MPHTKLISSSTTTACYYCCPYNKFHHYGSSFFAPSVHLDPFGRRRTFSRITTALFATKSSEDSSSETELSPLALSIEQALEELVVVKKEEDHEEIISKNEEHSSARDATVPSRLDTKQPQLPQETKQRFLLVLSVSGGCDSVALLHATMELQQKIAAASKWELDCHVVHFHHRQREIEADLDCQLVQKLAQEEYGIPFVLQDWNDDEEEEEEEAKGEQASISKFSQDRARQWRRRRLLEYTQSTLLQMESEQMETTGDLPAPIGVILTAHHRDDSEESLLLKLLRGVHILNLSGMEAITTTQDNRIYILRPWLKQQKADLQDYLVSQNKTWREDASNSSPKYLRNRIRNELIPLLEDISPRIHKRLEILEQQSYELQQDLEPQILAHLEQQTTKSEDGRCQYLWERQHHDLDSPTVSPLVESQALFRWMQQEIGHLSNDVGNRHAAASVSYETLQRVLKQLRKHPSQLDWSMDLGGKYQLQRKGSRLTIIREGAGSSETTGKRRAWRWSIGSSESACTERQSDEVNSSSSDFLTLTIPAEMLSSHLQFVETTVHEYAQILPKAASKRFCPPWKTKSVKLGQFLRGQKVPLHQRDAIPILYMTTAAAVEDVPPQDNPIGIVAIQVQGTWVVHADYNTDCQQENGDDVNESSGNNPTGLIVHVQRP